MKFPRSLLLQFLVVLLLATGASIGVAAQDPLSEWHAEAVRLTILPASNLAPAAQTRHMAIVQLSVHDAVNGISKRYRTYMTAAPAPAGASAEAAAIGAAHEALRTLFSGSAADLDTKFSASLALHAVDPADPGIAYGRAAAAAILAARSSDGASVAQFNYMAPGAGLPGVWQPLTAQPALLPGWGNVTPFVLMSGDQFRPGPPPELDSDRYARDLNEIKDIGSLNSTVRSADQTKYATFWLASPVAIWSQPLNDLIAHHGFDLSEGARAYALVYTSAADSSIACWEAKYFYNFWRPQPAIRRAAEDNNDATDTDAAWVPLFTTPRHPEYPSGHTTNSTAMVKIMQLIFGDAPAIPVRSTIGPTTREWASFEEGLDEVIEARIWSGLHFRTADEVGSRQGGQVARFVWTHALQECKGNICS
jgi:hypothetical protein